MNLLLLLLDSGLFWAANKAHRPTYEVVGHQSQLLASIFIETSSLNLFGWIFLAQICQFHRAKISKNKVTQNLTCFFIDFKVILLDLCNSWKFIQNSHFEEKL